MINPTTSSLVNGYMREAARPTSRLERTRTGPSVDAAQPRSPGVTSEPALRQSITAAEQQMIQEQFPETPRMSLRLYGPSRPAANAPTGLGSFIDLKG